MNVRDSVETPGRVVGVDGHPFRWRTGGGLQFTGQRRVEDRGPGRSQITLAIDGRFAGLLLPLRAFEPLIQAAMRRQVIANLNQPRKAVEARG